MAAVVSKIYIEGGHCIQHPKLKPLKIFGRLVWHQEEDTKLSYFGKKWPHNFTNSFLISQIIKNRILNIYAM